MIQTTDCYVPVEMPTNASITWIEEEGEDGMPKSVAIEKKEGVIVLTVEEGRELLRKGMWELYCMVLNNRTWHEVESEREYVIKKLLP